MSIEQRLKTAVLKAAIIVALIVIFQLTGHPA
jgi:hypothetical protein